VVKEGMMTDELQRLNKLKVVIINWMAEELASDFPFITREKAKKDADKIKKMMKLSEIIDHLDDELFFEEYQYDLIQGITECVKELEEMAARKVAGCCRKGGDDDLVR
jgi:hypothetical protein